ncbi:MULTISPECIES: group III truncated hemoglobin [unclassified Bradyrhizobium]|uniref:group III truncated hemoglobin n=1 Tax=unclassified Bradyrhizobium TaxID=2631580 RepID=UPI002915FAE3|nr:MULTISPECIES: group III truncated hemoglobin [unclassified Bradyrhizobium]
MTMPAAQPDRHPLAVQHPELDDASIRLLVETFYGRAREDELIGPIFNRAVEDWDEHIGRISDFWSSMFLKTGRYTGAPMRPHLLLSLRGPHFDRWLQLFEATAKDLLAPELAELFIVRARRIADSFEMGIASTRGDIVRPRHSV